MNMNLDYRRMLRAGYFAERNIVKTENESGIIIALTIGAAMMIILMAMVLQSCNHAVAGGV